MSSEAEDSSLSRMEEDGTGVNIIATVKLKRVFNEAFTTLSEFIGMRDVLVFLAAARPFF